MQATRFDPTNSYADGSREQPLNVAIVDEELPYPANSGKRIRTWNLIRRLAQQHHITYICHRNADPTEVERGQHVFSQLGIRTIMVDRPIPAKAGIGFYARLLRNLFSPLPYSVVSHESAALRQAIQKHARENQVDLWHCEWTPYFQALRGMTGAKRVVMAHNVESLIWKRYAGTETNSLKRWYIKEQWRKFVRFERDVVKQADQTIAVSEADANLFQDEFGARDVAVVENGVDVDFFAPDRSAPNPEQILFLGSLDWRPNLDALEQMLTYVFPKVQKQLPQVKFVIVGRNPGDSLRNRVKGVQGVELHFDVADVRPFIHKSAVMAVPLRIGGGSRLKILEALASALPVVSTKIGAEGLELEPAKELTICDGIHDMAEGLLEALQNPRRAQLQGERGRQKVLQRYDWEILARKLDDVWLNTLVGTRR